MNINRHHWLFVFIVFSCSAFGHNPILDGVSIELPMLTKIGGKDFLEFCVKGIKLGEKVIQEENLVSVCVSCENDVENTVFQCEIIKHNGKNFACATVATAALAKKLLTDKIGHSTTISRYCYFHEQPVYTAHFDKSIVMSQKYPSQIMVHVPLEKCNGTAS